MRILVSGFDPFGGEKINPAIESVKLLPDTIQGVEIIRLEIPTVIGKSVRTLAEAIEQFKPDVVLSVGQAGGRPDITVERVAINVDDCRIADNEGNQPIDTPIVENGPSAYFSTLPIKSIVNKMNENGIPASVSNTAGTFICNHVMYGVRHIAQTQYPSMRTGFIHIPYLPQQVTDKRNMPSMALETIVKGLTVALETIIATEVDEKSSAGTIC